RLRGADQAAGSETLVHIPQPANVLLVEPGKVPVQRRHIRTRPSALLDQERLRLKIREVIGTLEPEQRTREETADPRRHRVRRPGRLHVVKAPLQVPIDPRRSDIVAESMETAECRCALQVVADYQISVLDSRPRSLHHPGDPSPCAWFVWLAPQSM